MRKVILALWAASAVMAGSVSASQANVILTGTDFAGLTYLNNGPGTSASYVSSGGGYVSLSTPDNVGPGVGPSYEAQFNDTATVLIPNGYLGISLGSTLSDFLALSGAASFNLSSVPLDNGQYAYWNVELSNPNDPTHTAIINAWGGAPGVNGLNPNVSAGIIVGAYYEFPWLSELPPTWTGIAPQVFDGLALGSWSISGVTISVGGWNAGATTQFIDSITLPGTRFSEIAPPLETPLPAGAWLFGSALLGAAGMSQWRKHRPAAQL